MDILFLTDESGFSRGWKIHYTSESKAFLPEGYYSPSAAFVNTRILCPILHQKYGAHGLSRRISLPSSETCSLSINFRTISLSAARLGIT